MTYEDFKPEYLAHQERKRECNQSKEEDKEYTKGNDNFKAITFDLQQVLYTPFTDVNLLYYKRKLAVYNFTIYDQETRRGEIATCLLRYMEALPQEITHLSSFSDTCGGQNRNQFVASCLLYAVRTLPNLQIIDQKFMESGHSSMEVDSMHSTIERAWKYQKIYNVS